MRTLFKEEAVRLETRVLKMLGIVAATPRQKKGTLQSAEEYL
jgi:hypothetical protein